MAVSKEDFRFLIHKQLETIKKNKKIYDKRIIEALLENVIGKQKTILAYYPLPDEPELRDLYEILLKKKVTLCAPVYTGDSRKVEVRRFSSPDGFKKWKGKFMNPTGRTVDIKKIELGFIPGLAFDKSGYRIGRGGGYFDRLLSQVAGITTVGVGYSLQIFDTFEGVIEPHDIKLTRILTEQGFVK